jgi:hypothetical protein
VLRTPPRRTPATSRSRDARAGGTRPPVRGVSRRPWRRRGPSPRRTVGRGGGRSVRPARRSRRPCRRRRSGRWSRRDGASANEGRTGAARSAVPPPGSPGTVRGTPVVTERAHVVRADGARRRLWTRTRSERPPIRNGVSPGAPRSHGGRARGGRTGDAPRAVRRGPPAGPHGRRRRPRRARRRSARTGTATRRGRPGRDPGPTAGPLVRGLPSPWATARRRRGFRRRGGGDPGALADGAVRVAVAGSRGRRPSRPVPGRAADGDRPARNRPPGRARSDATDRFI